MKIQNENEIEYRLAIKEDKEAVLEFMQKHYFSHEPLSSSIEPKESRDKNLEDFLMCCVDTANHFCLLALYKNQIVGARMCAPKGPDEEQHLLKMASEAPNTKFSKVLVVLAALEAATNVFQKYKNINKAMHGNGLAVHSDYRGNGIGLKLFDKSIQIAKALGYPIFTSDCSSIYSARLSELLGMECINVFKMVDYREPGSNKQVIFPPEHQKYIKTYAKLLQ